MRGDTHWTVEILLPYYTGEERWRSIYGGESEELARRMLAAERRAGNRARLRAGTPRWSIPTSFPLPSRRSSPQARRTQSATASPSDSESPGAAGAGAFFTSTYVESARIHRLPAPGPGKRKVGKGPVG